MPLLYRIEHRSGQQSLWYNRQGQWDPVIFNLKSTAKAKELPMGFDPNMKLGGKDWISCTTTIPALACVFGLDDVIELEALGYGLFEIEATKYRSNEWHDLFLREDVLHQTELDMDLVKRALREQEQDRILTEMARADQAAGLI
jgi:hypothetical protein